MKKSKNQTQTVYGMTWLTREEWQKMREIAADTNALTATYEDWMLMAWNLTKDLESKGVKVKKVAVTTDIFAEWCKNNNRIPDNAARSEYVSYLMATEKALRGNRKT